jgi:PTH1 family peptidyl-tRNA hydrolase
MNLSGKSVNYWLQQLKIPFENSLVVTDDIALPLGKLRMRKKGSDAGHNGLKNIEQALGTSAYPRLKFGIGDDFHKGQQIDYVLGKFTQEEFDQLPSIMDRAIEMIQGFCTIGMDRTMNQYND